MELSGMSLGKWSSTSQWQSAMISLPCCLLLQLVQYNTCRQSRKRVCMYIIITYQQIPMIKMHVEKICQQKLDSDIGVSRFDVSEGLSDICINFLARVFIRKTFHTAREQRRKSRCISLRLKILAKKKQQPALNSAEPTNYEHCVLS